MLSTGTWCPLSWSFTYSTELSRQTCFLWGVWPMFQGIWNVTQTLWKPWTSDCSSLSFAHTSFSCFAFPYLLGCEWVRKFLLSTCFLTILINIWVFFLSNMGYKTNPINIFLKKGTLRYKTWELLFSMQIHWTLFLAFLLTCIHFAWSSPCAWEVGWWCCLWATLGSCQAQHHLFCTHT